LVLEKAARKSSSDDVLTSSTAKTSAAAEGSKAGAGAAPSAGTSKTQVAEGVKALGDGGRRANTNGTAFPVSTMGASVKGKGRMMGEEVFAVSSNGIIRRSEAKGGVLWIYRRVKSGHKGHQGERTSRRRGVGSIAERCGCYEG
jgi:hypothetical protein